MLTREVIIMGRPRRVFIREFKQEAVKLVTAGGHPLAQVARDLGMTPNLLRSWKHEVAGDPIAAFPARDGANLTKRSWPGWSGTWHA
jgi:transposase-like protein